ncbi:MAG: NAD(P)-binding domain-containing protein [Nitrolancea sp.]
MSSDTNVLVIGAGPFGLSLAAQLRGDGTDHEVVGRSMEFWQANMPAGMYLRSECDWHLDPLGIDTIEAYLLELGKTPAEVLPISLSFYLDYARWFQQRKEIAPVDVRVQRLNREQGAFNVELDDGQSIQANNVVLALGFEYFQHIPNDLAGMLSPERFSHTCDAVDLTQFAGQRVMIVGGRQSAFEWAALLLEQGATDIYVTHRHDSPAYAVADWSWVNPLVSSMVADPAWFRRLPREAQESIKHRMWVEGRMKVEPWLEDRLRDDAVRIWPRTRLNEAVDGVDGGVEIRLDNGQSAVVDHVIFATGYQVDLSRIPLLAAGNVLDDIATSNGYPVLDEYFQTSVPGLYITSLAASQDFGPFFGFTGAVRTSAKLIAASVSA